MNQFRPWSDRKLLRMGAATTCTLVVFAAMSRPAQGQCDPQQLARLIASDGAPNDLFGYSIAISGDTAVVGADVDDHAGGIDSGSVYVFVRAGDSWSEQAKLNALDAAAGDKFGYAVAVMGDTVVVGAQSDTHAGGASAGSAYVFVRSGTTWSQQAKLIASDAAVADLFGAAVALSGDTALVGATFEDNAGGSEAGSAYVFVRTGTVWTQQTKLIASDAAASDLFGSSVALSGDTAVVGATADDNAGGANAGSAYVFVRSGTTWTEQTKLTASDAATSDQFGVSVSISGDTALVGANGDDHPGEADAGSAYVFTRSGVTWTQQARLIASDAAAADNFGFSVALSGDTALIGAWQDDNVGGADAGAAFVFIRSGVVWTQHSKLIASDAAAGDIFGVSVALSGDTAVVGARADDNTSGSDAGSAYAFALACDDDGDGVADVNDGCPHDPTKSAPGTCGCGIVDSVTDTDSDGLPDCVDNCPATANADQIDTDGNGVGDVCADAPGGQLIPACGQQGSACGMGTVGLMPGAILMFRRMRPTRRRCDHP
ncbi:MAG: thrombospondin type 3 repeat-containing protein [Planctomycetes bacterium]|nr:thrombospondin type 3 repeat-containing protein [Planctomycetota bacterium]